MLDFLYQVTSGNLFIDNSCLADDEMLMREGRFYGYDNLINESTFFEIHSNNLRDSVISSKSHTINRIRQLIVSLSLFHKQHPATPLEELLKNKYAGKRVLLLENNSYFASVFSFFCKKYNVQLFTSEFFGEQYRSGEIVNNVLHVDIQDTHFEDNFFDLIIHTDVFEHVPDATKGEREIARILKPGGCAIFTVPFDFAAHEDNIFASIENGGIKYFQEPIYHDDPIAEDGKCLVFRIFAFPSTSKRFEELRCQLQCNYFHSRYMGILGNNAYSFTVIKQ